MKWVLCLFFPLFAFSLPYKPLRSPIAPFLSGDTFRASCDFGFDEITPRFDPQAVQYGNKIFINGDMLGDFFREVHPFITAPYILISHNTDHSIPGPYKNYLEDGKILAWFTQNQDETVHPKLHPLPIGVENRHWKPMNKEVLQRVKARRLPKKHLLYYNLNIDTYPFERAVVYQLFAHAPYCYSSRRKDYEPFIEDLASSKFVLSPRGNGLDTHRLWETLYVGSYPIVKTSSLDSLYEGLPVLIVKEWTDVTEEFLHEKYEEFKKKTFSSEKLYTDYWFQWIDSCK